MANYGGYASDTSEDSFGSVRAPVGTVPPIPVAGPVATILAPPAGGILRGSSVVFRCTSGSPISSITITVTPSGGGAQVAYTYSGGFQGDYGGAVAVISGGVQVTMTDTAGGFPIGALSIEVDMVDTASLSASDVRAWTVAVAATGDLAAQARSRVIIQYRQSTKLLEFIDVHVAMLQQIVDCLVQIPPLDDPSVATGVNLDVIGELVGQENRQLATGDTATDDEMLILIGARITRNSTKVGCEEYLAALYQLFQAPIDFTDDGGMSITYGVGRVPTADEIAVLDGDIVARPMGVKVTRFYFDATDYFGFAEDAGSTGYGDTDTDPAGGGYSTGF